MRQLIYHLLIIICLCSVSPARAFTSSTSIIESIPSVGVNNSQYSPFIVHQNGWASYLMYYCKNTVHNGISRDRVWRRESWTNGLTDWNNDSLVIDGQIDTDTDLSCSPGVVIDQHQLWHMYYVTANRHTPMTLHLYHSTAPSPGTQWTIQSEIILTNLPTYYETPTPLLINNQIVLYLAGDGGLWRTTSSDGFHFSPLEKAKLNPSINVQSGRVTYYQGVYYFTYSYAPNSQPPTNLFLASSVDGLNFTMAQTVASINHSGWDTTHIWSPHLFISDQEIRLYYAGNNGTYAWWGSNSSIGVRTFPLSALPSPADTDQDMDLDYHDYITYTLQFDNISPWNLLLSTKLDLFDYNHFFSLYKH